MLFVFITILCNGNTSVDLYYQQNDSTSVEQISRIFDENYVQICLFLHENLYSKTCLKQPLKIGKMKVLKTGGSLIQVKSIAECSKRAFCNTFDLH